MMPYPMLFRPILKPRVWGGRMLARLNKPLPPDEPIGESWELADLPAEIEDGQSHIANGPLTSKTLHEAIKADSYAILGSAHDTERFPLLIKYLDARENLSVQVHPDEAYACRHVGAHLKDEAWVVVDHQPGAVIYKGLRHVLDESAMRKRIASGEIANDLNAVEVKRGECHYLPSGTIHALGAGVLVAEVQTPSDTTFRMFDWGRSSRQLHVDQAIEVLFGGDGAYASGDSRSCQPQPPMLVGHVRSTQLLETPHFAIERIEMVQSGVLDIITADLPEIWMILEGRGSIGGEVPVHLAKGATVLLPAALPQLQAQLDCGIELLRITLPSPLRGMIA